MSVCVPGACTCMCLCLCVCVCICVLVCISERREINPMLSPIPGYEFTASVWPSHCLNNNLINPVFISFSELGRQAGRAWGRTGNAGRKYQGGRGRKPSARAGIWEEFNGRDLGLVNGNRDVKRRWGRRETGGVITSLRRRAMGGQKKESGRGEMQWSWAIIFIKLYS